MIVVLLCIAVCVAFLYLGCLSGTNAEQRRRIDKLSQRVDELEQSVAALQAQTQQVVVHDFTKRRQHEAADAAEQERFQTEVRGIATHKYWRWPWRKKSKNDS